MHIHIIRKLNSGNRVGMSSFALEFLLTWNFTLTDERPLLSCGVSLSQYLRNLPLHHCKRKVLVFFSIIQCVFAIMDPTVSIDFGGKLNIRDWIPIIVSYLSYFCIKFYCEEMPLKPFIHQLMSSLKTTICLHAFVQNTW